MFSYIAVGVVCALIGFIAGAILCYRRLEGSASQGPRFPAPANKLEADFTRSFCRQWEQWRCGEETASPLQAKCVADALQRFCLTEGVILVENGIATLPWGEKINMWAIANEVQDVVSRVYAALDDAASRLPGGVGNQADRYSFSRKFRYEDELCGAARLLGVDPWATDAALNGASRLWKETQEYEWPTEERLLADLAEGKVAIDLRRPPTEGFVHQIERPHPEYEKGRVSALNGHCTMLLARGFIDAEGKITEAGQEYSGVLKARAVA
ncbi:MAG TPA: hypothetical protein VF450_12770 [Noviherbaspirillum sp.]